MALFSKYCEQSTPNNVRFLPRISSFTPSVLLRYVVHLVSDMDIGLPETDDRIELAISRPAMNLRGIRGGDVGAS